MASPDKYCRYPDKYCRLLYEVKDAVLPSVVII